MKTEDLKNYIFEQLNETSDALKRKLEDGRVKQAMRAYDTSHDIAQENFKIKKQTGSFDPSLLAVRDIISNRANKAHNSYTKANNRRNGLKGDGSPRTPKQESALNFINGLKRLNETSFALKRKVYDARWEQGFAASKDSNSLYREYKGEEPITGKPGKRGLGYGNPALLAVRDIRNAEMNQAWAKAKKAKNRSEGLKGDGSPRTP